MQQPQLIAFVQEATTGKPGHACRCCMRPETVLSEQALRSQRVGCSKRPEPTEVVVLTLWRQQRSRSWIAMLSFAFFGSKERLDLCWLQHACDVAMSSLKNVQ